jgi:hypothetical protein
MDPYCGRDRVLDALRGYSCRRNRGIGVRRAAESACSACGHPVQVHAELASWCARCAAPCDGGGEPPPVAA